MRRALPLLAAVLVLAVVPLGPAEVSYSDPAGDSGVAPDITAMTVSNTATTVAFHVETALVPNSLLGVYVDDRDASTGQMGLDRIVAVTMDENGRVQALLMDGFFGFVRPLTANVTVRAVDVAVPTTDLGIRTGFRFFAATGDTSTYAMDSAPDDGQWSYELSQAVVKPVIGAAVTTGAPIAGKRFVVSFPVTRSDDGSRFTDTASVTCRTTVAGRTVSHAHTFAGGTVRAVVAVPRGAKGKQLKIAVKVSARNQAATKVVTFKVR